MRGDLEIPCRHDERRTLAFAYIPYLSFYGRFFWRGRDLIKSPEFFFFFFFFQLDQRWKNVEPVSISDDAFPFFLSNGKSLGYFGALQQRFREILSRSLCVSLSHYRFEGDEYY